MASGDTKTNQYLDIAANGTRADLPSDTCCETRTQTLIRGVAERVIGVEEEVERLENNPDVVDIVATYQDLQNYDTSGLTDKDIIRVLEDSTHNNNSTYYRWNATTNQFDFVGEISGGGESSGIIELTSADYDYPTNNPTSIALWNLDTGTYQLAPNTALKPNDTDSTINTSASTLIILNNDGPNTWGNAIMYNYGDTINEHNGRIVVTGPDGLKAKNATIDTPTVVQTTGTSTTDVMSQNATTSMVYHDDTKTCIQIGLGASASGTSLSHSQIAIGTNAVASYNGDNIAIGSYAKSSALNRGIAIGANASTAGRDYCINIGGTIRQYGGDNNIAIGGDTGGNSHAYCVALGHGSACTRTGEVNIRAGSSNGYNSTAYRVLGGVHDPVDAHDAATKGYVDANAGVVTFYSSVNPTITASNVSLYSDKACTNAIQTSTFFQAIRSGKTVSIEYGGSGDFDSRQVCQVVYANITNVDTADAYNEVGPYATYFVGSGTKTINASNPDPSATNGFTIE